MKELSRQDLHLGSEGSNCVSFSYQTFLEISVNECLQMLGGD
jgi:hypothetical protein